MNIIISLVFCMFYANGCLLVAVQNCVAIYWAGQGAEGCFSPQGLKALNTFVGSFTPRRIGPPDRFTMCRVMTAKQHKYGKESSLICC